MCVYLYACVYIHHTHNLYMYIINIYTIYRMYGNTDFIYK